MSDKIRAEEPGIFFPAPAPVFSSSSGSGSKGPKTPGSSVLDKIQVHIIIVGDC